MLILPTVAASLLMGSDDQRHTAPKVIQVLESVSAEPTGSHKTTRASADAPVGDTADDKQVAISFRRGSKVPVGYLEIPAIDLETKFYDGVIDASVERGPGHWPGTPWPGETGNSVFAGHRTTYTRPFADLDLLKEGQRVRARVRNGPRITYRIFRKTVVPEAEYVDFVLKQPPNEAARMITLFACTPKGFRTHRIVVQAKALPAVAGKNSKQKKEGAMGGNS